MKEGDSVKAGQVLMKLDTEASEQQRKSLETSMKLKREQLNLKQMERQRYEQVNNAEVQMLENNLALHTEILSRCMQLNAAGAFSEVQLLTQKNSVEETRGRLMQTRADRHRQLALLDQQHVPHSRA
mgnify:CR=1 FL=1